jgi:hypothetical protein
VTGVSPACAPGGTSVTVTGSGFTGATAVNFGGTTINDFSLSTTDQDTVLTVTVPSSGSGTVDVTVTTPEGTSPIVPQDQFTFLTVTGIWPPSGVTPSSVTVYGSGFIQVTAVNFDGNSSYNWIAAPDGTQLTAVLPAMSPNGSGIVNVTVTTESNGVSSSQEFQYTQVTSWVPVNQNGRAVLAVTGSGFISALTTVTIIGAGDDNSDFLLILPYSEAGVVQVQSSTVLYLECSLPDGQYSVTVQTPYASSPNTILWIGPSAS